MICCPQPSLNPSTKPKGCRTVVIFRRTPETDAIHAEKRARAEMKRRAWAAEVHLVSSKGWGGNP